MSFNVKALGAFKKLGAVALITATMFFVACNQTGGGGGKPTPTPKPKHAITFSVDGANGKLTAKVDGGDIASGKEVEEGKAVTFTAEPSANYKVKEWKVGNTVVTGNKTNTYTHTVKNAVTVKVSFEKIPPTKHAVSFTVVDGKGGTLTAKVDGGDIASGKEVEEGKTVTFTATANDGYRVKGWTLNGNAVNGTAETYTHTVTQATTVSVSFELSPVEGGAVLMLDPDKLNIEVTAKTADGSAITVEGCKETTLASGTTTTLTATGTRVVLKGKITELSCSDNKLTALNVQGLTYLQMIDCGSNQLTELNVEGCTSLKGLGCGDNKLTSLNLRGLTSLQTLFCGSNQLTSLNVQDLTALQRLYCPGNQLNAQAMTKLLKGLPSRAASDDARAVLYTEETDKTEGNCKDFTQSEDLKKAFDGAKKRNWKLQKIDASESNVDL